METQRVPGGVLLDPPVPEPNPVLGPKPVFGPKPVLGGDEDGGGVSRVPPGPSPCLF